MVLAWTIKVGYRKIHLQQELGDRQLHKPKKVPTIDEFLGGPLITEFYEGTDLHIYAWFVVPKGEMWLLYSAQAVVSGGAAANHQMEVHIGVAANTSVNANNDLMIHDGWVQAGEAKATLAGAEATGPFARTLYPMLLREGEYVAVDCGYEQA